MSNQQHAPDDLHLAGFGYQRKLERSLGFFSAFAVSYGWVAVLVGVSALFFFGYANAGPAFFWVFPVVGAITTLICLCLAEMAGQVPVTGSIYQWARHVSRSRFVPWTAGWFLTAAMLVSVTLVGPTLQGLLPTLWSGFEVFGGPDDMGTSTTPGGALNAIFLGTVAIVLMAVINILGVRWMARVANAVVVIEISAAAIVIIGFATHIRHSASVILHSNGIGADQTMGYFGALLIASIAGCYVLYGFENAAMVAEETVNAREVGPKAILRSTAISMVIGLALVLFTILAAGDLSAPELSTVGFPYVVSTVLGPVFGTYVLISTAIAAFGAQASIMATGARMLFAMARDGVVPFSRQLAHVPRRVQTPVLPVLVVAVFSFALLFLNYGNPQIFSTLGSLPIVLFFICYALVLGPMLAARLRGEWPGNDHGRYFSLGRWGLPVNVLALIGTIAVVVNVGWPRTEVYGNAHWYLQYGAVVLVALLLLIGLPYYWVKQRSGTVGVMAEHRANEAQVAGVRALAAQIDGQIAGSAPFPAVD